LLGPLLLLLPMLVISLGPECMIIIIRLMPCQTTYMTLYSVMPPSKLPHSTLLMPYVRCCVWVDYSHDQRSDDQRLKSGCSQPGDSRYGSLSVGSESLSSLGILHSSVPHITFKLALRQVWNQQSNLFVGWCCASLAVIEHVN
jgi:hypothetical protein